MKKWKEKKEILKQLWSDKRYRAWILLGGYFVFFMILAIVMRTASPVTEEHFLEEQYDASNVIAYLEELNKKDYKYQLVVNNDYELNGQVSNGANSFSYQEKEYVIIYNNLYNNNNYELTLVKQVIPISIPIQNLTLEKILLAIKDIEPQYKKINEKKWNVLYDVSASNFTSLEDQDTINIKLRVEEEKIIKIEISYLADSYVIIIKE